jgi:hypothetical protein
LLRGSREDLVAVGPDSTVDVVAGVTVDAAPEAVPGRVLMVDVTGRGWGALPSARVEVDGGLLSGSTGEDGSARIAGLPLGAIRVAVSWPTFCDGDPGWVPLFSGGGAEPSLAAPTDAAQLSFVLPPDADADGMDDDWELLHGLDPSRDDGGLDPDGDGLTNLTAYRMGLLPTEPSRACERTDSQALALVFGAVFASIRRPRRGEDSLDAAEPRPHPPAAER